MTILRIQVILISNEDFLMCNVENYPFNDSKIQTTVEKESQLPDSKATRFTVPGKTLKTIPWKEFDDDSSDELESIDEPPPQQS